jgi:hypothetical protein
MNKRISRTSALIVITVCAIAGASLIYIKNHYQTIIVDVPKFVHQSSVQSTTTVSNSSPGQDIPTPTSYKLSADLLLPVPFTPQAPTGNWDTIHNEDCEEASAIMANAYYNGPKDAKLSASYVESQLTKLTDWEMQNFGYNLDVTSEETVKMIEASYGLQAKILYGFTEDEIKNELAQNHLVLLPANGQMLGNPNYKQPGPKYHMLVIRGFTSTTIITNDPGTRNGLNYPYSFDTLYKANGNWSHADNKVDLSQKNIIVVWK